MANRKRSRAADDVDGEEEVEIESASSSFQQTHHNKRSRVALAAEPRGSAAPDEEEYYDELLARDHSRASTADPANLSLHIDSSDNESESEPIDELQATQVVNAQRKKQGENIAAEQGVIMEIHIRNFMCHSNVRVPFGPLINFITGANGSGKSAILTALQVCLGTKAKSTNRAPNLSSMVKTGQDTASLAVKIKNEGEDAFKPTIYGNSITVERHFTRSGASSFKIKNDQGKIITTKKKDLDEITESFGLQLDNPINVLTQDRAREFLSNSTPAEKYKFFIQGTQLQSLDGDYKLMEEKLEMIRDVVLVADSDLEIFKDKARKAEEKKKRLDRAASMQEKMRDVERQHAWSQVEEQERYLERVKADVTRQEETHREKEEAAGAAGDVYEAQNTAFESTQRAIAELNEQLTPKQEEADKRKKKFDTNKDEILKLHTEQRSMNERVKSAKAMVTRLESQIAEEQERISGSGGVAHQDRLEELEILKTKAKDAKVVYDEHQKATADRVEEKETADKDVEESRKDLPGFKRNVESAQQALSATQRDQGNSLRAYHQNMDSLVQAIGRESRWRSKPVGPLGSLIRITVPEWSGILEKTFGNALNAFVVTNRDDQTILSGMIAKHGVHNSSVFISSARGPLDTHDKEPDAEYATILRILRIDDHLVSNTLIINHGIDQTVLIREEAEGNATMFPADGSYPRNVRAVLTHASNQGWGRRLERTRAGNQKNNPIQPWNGPFRMKADREEQLRMQRAALDSAKRAEAEATNKFRALQQVATKASQALERHKRDAKRLLTEAQKAEDAVEALQSVIDSNKPQTGRLDELKSQLEEAIGDVESEKGSFADSVQSKAQLDVAARGLKTEMDAAQHEVDVLGGSILKQEERLKRCETARQDALFEKNKQLDEVKKTQEHLDRLKKKVETQEENLQTYLAGAERVCARVHVEPGVEPAEFENRLERLQEQYEREEQQAGGSMEELVAAHRKAQKEYEDKKKSLRTQKRTAEGLREARQERRRRWGLFRKYITVRAKTNFQYLLSERQFRGRILMSHTDKTLGISVEPDVTRTSDSGRQAATLSGGEKSFSQICLLLSIWEAMGSPIRCLDEFDVFMDNVNRDMSIGIMIEAARRSVGRQFILISPNTMDKVPDASDVRKFRMPEPNRGREPGQMPLPGAS